MLSSDREMLSTLQVQNQKKNFQNPEKASGSVEHVCLTCKHGLAEPASPLGRSGGTAMAPSSTHTEMTVWAEDESCDGGCFLTYTAGDKREEMGKITLCLPAETKRDKNRKLKDSQLEFLIIYK